MRAVADQLRLRADGITVSFGERRLLSGLDLDALGGQMVAVTGPSGTGKTTLLMVLAGVLKPDVGTIDLSGAIRPAPAPAPAAVAAEGTVPEPAQSTSNAGYRSDPLLVPDIAPPPPDISASAAAMREAVAEQRSAGGLARAGGRRVRTDANLRPGRSKQRIGYVPQTLGLAPWLTATENVAIVLQILALPPEVVRRRTEKVLADVGLGAMADRLVTELSGGQRQRVAVARALATQPDVVIADEPTAELDAENRQLVLALMLQAAADGALVIVATHDPDVSDACNLVYELSGGRLAGV